MSDKEIVDSKIIDTKATDWINEVAPKIFEQLDNAQIHYDEEMVCHLLGDGFKIGYATAIRDALDDNKKLI